LARLPTQFYLVVTIVFNTIFFGVEITQSAYEVTIFLKRLLNGVIVLIEKYAKNWSSFVSIAGKPSEK